MPDAGCSHYRSLADRPPIFTKPPTAHETRAAPKRIGLLRLRTKMQVVGDGGSAHELRMAVQEPDVRAAGVPRLRIPGRKRGVARVYVIVGAGRVSGHVRVGDAIDD